MIRADELDNKGLHNYRFLKNDKGAETTLKQSIDECLDSVNWNENPENVMKAAMSSWAPSEWRNG